MVEESLGGAKPEVSSSSRPLENQSLTEAKIKPAEGVISVRNKQMAENGVKCEKATLVMIPPGPSALREGAGSGVLGLGLLCIKNGRLIASHFHDSLLVSW
ncbi:hypothetical protein QC763_117323 [Podospora pseudopauciseta]|uniref:Uncharacterized protein n=1 Tax=Podospora pseudopauciseta TaxID=2093780 RepID=A0ABR0I1T8_9PEZI|nr:hypothetical protein QC763_117323 [Podospora pseudopauciseta]